MDEERSEGPKWLDIPSQHDGEMPRPAPGQVYHDLAQLYPHAPVPRKIGETVVQRAVLHDVNGLESILDWAADGSVVIVELGNIIDRNFELNTAIEHITKFVKGDLGGSLLQLGDERVLILPPTVVGLEGLDREVHEHGG